MSRRLLLVVVAGAAVAGAGYAAYTFFFQVQPRPKEPVFDDDGATLSTQQQFDKLAKTDPVKMLAECLKRYQREVKHGVCFTLEKQERVQGKPAHPDMPPVEVIDACVRGDVPDPDTHATAIEVRMKWTAGARWVYGAEVRGTLFSEKPKADGGLDGKVITWRPDAFIKTSPPFPPNSGDAKKLSRYCVRDAGLYRSMLRTHEAWEKRQDAGELKVEYLGTQTPKAVGRECHAIRRVCSKTEIDAFEIGGTASSDPAVVAAEGFTEVTIFIDAERWLQVGTELHRTEPGGTRVLVGAYYFRDVKLNPTFPPGAFTADALKR